MAQRIYKAAAIYDARIAGMRNLWEPSREYMGKPVEKPNYLVTVIVKKTRAQWFEEPALANFTQACQSLYTEALAPVPYAQIAWPIRDGDVADPGKAPAEWRAGHWTLMGSSSSPIEVSIVQSGVITPLRNRVDVKSGDYVMVAAALAVNSNNPRAVKCYINKVVFTAPGDEIVIGTSVSAAELMEQAKAQGLNVTGFGGGGAPQQQGFGLAPNPFPSGGLAPAPVSPPAQQGFTAPGNFNAPGGFPQR